MRWCLTCKGLFDMASNPGKERCKPCQARITQRRNARSSSSSRGLGWDWTRAKQNDPNYQAATRCQCKGCGHCGSGCGKPFTRANPKTGEHPTPRSKGGQVPGSIPALCRSCNSSKGGALR